MTEKRTFGNALWKKILSIALQLSIIGLLGWYLYQNREVLSSLRNIQWQHIVGIVVLDISQFLIGSYINYSMVGRLDRNVTFIDSFMLQYVNNLLNKILPTIGGGAAFRAYYLKKKYEFPYAYFASTIAGLYIVSFFTTSLIGLVCTAVIYAQFKTFNLPIFLTFLGILLVTLIIGLFSPQVPKSDSRIIKLLRNIIDGWNTLKKDPVLVITYTLLTMLLLFVSTLQIYISYQALGVQTNIIAMLFLSTLGIILAFINFTPDGIGVKEGIYVFSKNLVLIEPGVLILGSLLLRGVSIITTFIIGGISYWLLMRNLKNIGQDHLVVIKDT